MTKDEALKLALEALEPLVSLSIEPEDLAGIYKAITAIKEALAQPEQYDQTALELCDKCGWRTLIPEEACLNCERKAQPEQEPVAFPNRRAVEREIERIQNPKGMNLNDGKERVILPGGTLRYLLALADRATSPQRPWVPLTDEERASFEATLPKTQEEWDDLFNGIEAKLKEKNT